MFGQKSSSTQWSGKSQNKTVSNGHFWSKNAQNYLFLVVFFVFLTQKTTVAREVLGGQEPKSPLKTVIF